MESRQLVTNVATTPRGTRFVAEGVGGFGNERWNAQTTYSLQSSGGPADPDITTFARGVLTASTAGPGFHLAHNPEVGAPTTAPMLPVTAGVPFAFAVWSRFSIASICRLGWRFSIGTTWLTTTQFVDTALSANVWTRLSSGQLTVPATATHVALYVINNATQPIGYTFDATGLVVAGVDPGFHVDGDTSGWKWSGTAPHSSSSGPLFSL